MEMLLFIELKKERSNEPVSMPAKLLRKEFKPKAYPLCYFKVTN